MQLGMKCVLIIGEGRKEADSLIKGVTSLLGQPRENGDNTLKDFSWEAGPGGGSAGWAR